MMCDEFRTEFNFYRDTPLGKDPDAFSPTLKRYHRLLWSKPLPCGAEFTLDDSHPDCYLHHHSTLGEFRLSSDAITHSYRSSKKMATVIAQVPPGIVNRLFDVGSTVGAYTIFPANKIHNKATINGARGMHPKIRDRFDITLECIRRFYSGGESPLSNVLDRYGDFFSLFDDFRGYVEFFHLQDLVTADFEAIRFFLPYQCFKTEPLPRKPEEYVAYQVNVMQFVRARAERMKRWVLAKHGKQIPG